jgi:hypothetical protein
VSELKEIERAAHRLERAMDEAYSRYLGVDEEQRIEGVAAALRNTLESVPENARPFLLEMLAERYEPDAPRADDRAAAEIAALKMENEQLRREVEAAQRRRMSSPGVAEALLGAAARGGGGLDEERVAAAVRAVREFIQTLAENLLQPPGKRVAKQQVGERVQQALTAQLSGGDDAAWGALLDDLKKAIAAHLGAVRPACREGGLFLLQQLDPAVLEAEEGVAQANWLGGVLGSRERELFRAFERRYARLVRDEELYETYFAPYYGKWLHDILRSKPPK